MNQGKWKRIPEGKVTLPNVRKLLEPHVVGIVESDDGLIVAHKGAPANFIALLLHKEQKCLAILIPFTVEPGVPEGLIDALLRKLNAMSTQYRFAVASISDGLLLAKCGIPTHAGISARQCLGMMNRSVKEVLQMLEVPNHDELDLLLPRDEDEPEEEQPQVKPKTILA